MFSSNFFTPKYFGKYFKNIITELPEIKFTELVLYVNKPIVFVSEKEPKDSAVLFYN